MSHCDENCYWIRNRAVKSHVPRKHTSHEGARLQWRASYTKVPFCTVTHSIYESSDTLQNYHSLPRDEQCTEDKQQR